MITKITGKVSNKGFCADCGKHTEVDKAGFCSPCILRMREESIIADIEEDLLQEED